MPPFVVIWIWLCAYLNCAGWTLSALHQLNAGGYAVALAAGLAGLLVWLRKTGKPICPRIYWPKLRQRFARGFPLAFLILASLALLGGAWHGPTNYDALAYRTPRVLHWLAEGQWHWVHTIFDRLNSRACAVEWVSAPLIALVETDRLLFLINMVSWLLLPGLVFSFFTRLGVRRRAAWHWMWLVPTGYCFLLQAGSIGNDLFGAVFALAAMDYALRAAKTGAAGDIAVSVLAAALMVGSKFGNVPLLLPWSAAIFPVVGKILRRPVGALAVGLAALLSSGLPIMVDNQIKLHDWSGAGISRNGPKTDMLWRFADNCALLSVQNLAPPVFPFSQRWHDFVQSHIPAGINAHLNQAMLESGAAQFDIPEMQMEESAGLGLGVSLMALAAFAAARPWRRGYFPPAGGWSVQAARWLPWVALLAVFTQSGMSALARLLTAYYVLLLPLLLMGAGQERLVRRRWWRGGGYAVLATSGLLLFVSPARPLFPVSWITDAQHVPDRAKAVYSVYAKRHDGFAPARALLPPGLKTLGFIAYDSPETSLWYPFGHLRVEHIYPEDTAADLKQRGIEYLLAPVAGFEPWFNQPLDEWVAKMHGQVVAKTNLQLRVSRNLGEWYLIRLKAGPP